MQGTRLKLQVVNANLPHPVEKVKRTRNRLLQLDSERNQTSSDYKSLKADALEQPTNLNIIEISRYNLEHYVCERKLKYILIYNVSKATY